VMHKKNANENSEKASIVVVNGSMYDTRKRSVIKRYPYNDIEEHFKVQILPNNLTSLCSRSNEDNPNRLNESSLFVSICTKNHRILKDDSEVFDQLRIKIYPDPI